MIRVAKISMAHVHAGGYAQQIHENPETELVAIWDEEEYGGKQQRNDMKSRSIPTLMKS